MARPDATQLLKANILQLETRQAEEGKELREQFKTTYESLKPVNLLKRSIEDISRSPDLQNNLMGNVLTLATVFLTRKMMTGSKNAWWVKLAGLLMQVSVPLLLSQYGDNIRQFFYDWIDKLFKKEEEPDLVE